jgi:serine/threonine-protein kinase
MGSPAYMSPEQCKNSADVDLRSDIYSFATMLYEMLAGRTPHLAASGTEMLVMHLIGTISPLCELVADVPAHVEAAIMRGLARERADRFDSISAFLDGLLRSVSAGSIVHGQPAASKISPADGTSPTLNVERAISLPAATTFSRATGEVAAAPSDELLAAIKKPRRWPLVAIGGLVAAGLAIFLLTRPGQESPPRAVPVAEPARAILPAEQHTPQSSLPAVLPTKPDAGLPAPAMAETPPVTEPGHATVLPARAARRPRHEARNPPPPKTVENAKHDQGVGAQPPKKPEDVAGF